MSLETLIQDVLDLDEKATKGPWSLTTSLIDLDDDDKNPKDWSEIGPIKSCDHCPIAKFIDGHLASNYRTSAPKLARACEILIKAIAESRNRRIKTILDSAIAEIEKVIAGEEDDDGV